MPGTLQPLDQKFAIVDSQGRPTEYFIRWAQQKQIDIGDAAQLDGGNDFTGDQDIKGKITATEGFIPAYKISSGLSLTEIWTNRLCQAKVDQILIRNDQGSIYMSSDSGSGNFGINNAADDGGAYIGYFSAQNRLLMGTYGVVPGFEFVNDPYVSGGAAGYKIYHQGNLSFGAGLTYNAGTGVLTSAGGGGGAIGRKLLTAMPALAGFTQVNIGGTRSIVEVAGKAFTVIESSPAAGPKIAGVIKAVPGATPYRIVFYVTTNAPSFQYLGFAFGWSDGTKLHTVSNPASGSLEEMKWTNSTTRASTVALGTRRPEWFQATGHWYAIRNNGTNIYFETSEDGVNFSTYLVVALAGSFLGAGGYTNAFCGLYSEANTASGVDYPHSVSIFEWDNNGLTRVFDA